MLYFEYYLHGTDTRSTMSALGQGQDVVMTQIEPIVYQPKLRVPDTFNRKYKELKRFLIQYDLYIEIHKKDFESKTDKVLFTSALLRGTAADWVEPYVRDQLDSATAAVRRQETCTIFADYTVFKQIIVNIFGNPGEDRQAARKLNNLRQGQGSLVAYTFKFQQLQVKTGWDDKASVDQYYISLNPKIKDNIANNRKERPTGLQAIIRLTSDIWDRIQERAAERKDYKYTPK
jgi:hypothetical protein